MDEKVLIPVNDYSDLRRDSFSRGVVNVSEDRLVEAKVRKEKILQEKVRLSVLEQRINTIEEKLDISIKKFDHVIDLLGKL